MNILNVTCLTKTYGKSENKCEALKEVTLSIEKGKFTSIVGPSGSGKSTLLHCMAGLDTPTSGKVLLDGQDIFSLSEEKLSALRRQKLGFIFQSFNLIPVINVYENIVLPITLDNRKVDREYIEGIVSILGINDKMNKFPNELSGGQQQRVAIARALSNKPEIIFADEPTGNLDSKSTEDVVMLLKMCVDKFGQTLVMITHNNDIAKLSDVCITIKDGEVLKNG
ncbi:ABC transporter ATP-binding protein [Romboutsia lituseburensis]|uniref:Putative ABC transport system ATP-binding protein n=1 Tax=Romboutsia lituseburensis DSM 797 TaxID=1121325 RepID=A0A1G9K9I1_9FIRM|nr:ABC transporter ATP-binding protein [Romboutsia lituseburensis]CEH34820.1 ABC transporter ATP-binding protein YxdL [Romboutsia lituseburensis]SDL46401.1 putative ABC transport system ATP-binding protein [Romboutsia lituseburensis DSM 797]